MQHCSVCGHECECFEVISGHQHFYFDRIECAIGALQSRCNRCGEKIYSEATDGDGNAYCSEQCAYAWDNVEDLEISPSQRRVSSRAGAPLNTETVSRN